MSFPWDKVTAESIETGSYDAAPLAGTAQQLSPVTTPANAASKNGVTYVSDNPNVVSVDSEAWRRLWAWARPTSPPPAAG